MGFNNAGGSIGSGALVVVILWALHCLSKRSEEKNASNGHGPRGDRDLAARGPSVPTLSPQSFHYLVRATLQSCGIVAGKATV